MFGVQPGALSVSVPGEQDGQRFIRASFKWDYKCVNT